MLLRTTWASPVTATDPAPNMPTRPMLWPTALSGTDAAKFRVRQDDVDTTEGNEGGQIEVAAGTKLDYETQSTYTVTVTVEDTFGLTASIDVTIMVTDVDERPDDRRGRRWRTIPRTGRGPVATFTATDPEEASDHGGRWTGADAGALRRSPTRRC